MREVDVIGVVILNMYFAQKEGAVEVNPVAGRPCRSLLGYIRINAYFQPKVVLPLNKKGCPKAAI